MVALNAGEVRLLEEAAEAAAAKAYAPYSRFRVGAALLSGDGRVTAGCNVENASYGLCLCAERNALSTAVAAGIGGFRAIAVACIDAREDLGLNGRMPCGACRQWLLELMPDGAVIVAGTGRQFAVRDLLPHGFEL
jgi:cytidine deaminase